eukprot:TRINITY_DN20333_c0_g1_i1.p1 TRINITY_DN20333_c0_g1~~TRINITY_DN20333_c0_g1_i1.p1  ORF type:complete len:129 (+),score=12.49 TRINITY_DN20333_c0_g1_i1:204-590(+)
MLTFCSARALESIVTSYVYITPMLCAIYFVISRRAQAVFAGSPFLCRLLPVWIQRLFGTCVEALCKQTATCAMAGASLVQDVEVPGVNGSSIIQTPPQNKIARLWLSTVDFCPASLCMVLVRTFVGLA